MKFNRKNLSNKKLISIYRDLLLPRKIEEKMLILLRQNRITKWFSGIGQEAISVGATLALEEDEFILPMHRNLGVFTTRKIPLYRLFAQFQGKLSGFTKGRDRSFHFGSKEHHIVGMISHLGPQLSVADGIALADLIDQKPKATLVFTGDGGTSEGEFHEALNVASVWSLPVIFIIENNGYGLSTPSNQQFNLKSFVEKGPGYGMEAVQVDGNNVLEVYDLINKLAAKIRRKPRPILVEAITFRMRGHEEASGTKYVPKELMEHWATLDPISNYEQFLLKNKVLSKEEINDLEENIHLQIEENLDTAYAESKPRVDTADELLDVYALSNLRQHQVSQDSSKMRFVDAVSDALRQSLERYDNLIFMGQDVAEYGGVFKVSQGFLEEFGPDRIRNTPLCESAIVGVGLGLSIQGKKAVIEMQFADFVSCGFNQIINNLAKIHYRWGQAAEVVIRMPTGAGVAAGPFHSQSNEAWFTHTPGLKVVYPSSPQDAKGLLCAAIEDPNPVMFFEHKALYRALTEEVRHGFYCTEIGKAHLVQEGSDLSIITYGMGVHWSIQLLEEYEDLAADVLDLRSLLPWDKEAVRQSVEKTGKVLVVHEDCLTGGFGGEIAAWISEHCFTSLDAPVVRVGSLDTPVPFINELENNFLGKSRLKRKLQELIDF